MLSLHLTTLALTLLTPTTAHPAPQNTTQHWTIPSMALHMMTRDSGLPGGTWPESTQFPSTIAFTLHTPSQTALCTTHFANGTLPIGRARCDAPRNVSFAMRPYSGLGQRRHELSFVLGVWVDTAQGVFAGEVEVTANQPAERTSYLTCLAGAPFEGLRCALFGVMSNRREVGVEARAVVGGVGLGF